MVHRDLHGNPKTGKTTGQQIFTIDRSTRETDYKSLKIRESPLWVLASSTNYAYIHSLSLLSPSNSLCIHYFCLLYHVLHLHPQS